MKKFILGFLSGAFIFSAVTVFALEVMPNPFPVKINGQTADIEGYNIDGRSYFQLRDIGGAVGFKVDWDEPNQTVVIQSADAPAPSVSPAPTYIPTASYPDIPDGEVGGKTEDGLNIIVLDGFGYVSKSSITSKLKAMGYDYIFGTDSLADGDTLERVITGIPVHEEYGSYIPVNYYISTILPYIDSLDK